MSKRITITDESLVVFDGSVALVHGTDVRTGKPVCFGMDTRPAMELKFEAVEQGSIEVEVEPWQILATWRAS